MYNYYDDSIQYKKKPSNLGELTKKLFKVKRGETGVTRSGKLGTTLKSRLPFLESVACQFSSLPIFVDCNKVRKHFEYILYAWMEAFQV